MTYKFNIAHLYAPYLNIYGDIGNIIALKQRCQWRGIEVSVESISSCQEIIGRDFDLFFIGGGQDKQQEVIAYDLAKYAKEFKSYVDDTNCVVLAICGGYQLLGHYYKPHTGDKLPGISLIDAYTVASNTRMIGNVVVKLPDGSTLVGFENHSGKTHLGSQIEPIGKVLLGCGNNGEDGGEGAHYKNIFGTYLHGSLLPKNPNFADKLILLGLQRKYNIKELNPLVDDFENLAHNLAVNFKR